MAEAEKLKEQPLPKEKIRKLRTRVALPLSDRQLFLLARQLGLVHYVKGSERQSGYWRVKPYTYENPTTEQLKARLKLSEAAVKGRKEGTITLPDGRKVPKSIMYVKGAFKGKEKEEFDYLSDSQKAKIRNKVGLA